MGRYPGCLLLTGCQRSGTTLLGLMLDGHSGVDLVDEDHTGFHRQAGATLLLDLDRVRAAASEHPRRLLFKAPRDSFRVAEILRALPGTRILWLTRPVEQVVASMQALRLSSRSWALTHAPREIHKYLDAFAGDRAIAEAFALARNEPRERAREISLATLCWLAKDRARRAAAAGHPEAVQGLDYVDLVTAPEATTRAACSFLGLDWEAAVLRHHETHSGSRIGGTEAGRAMHRQSIGLWRTRLSSGDCELIWRTLERCGENSRRRVPAARAGRAEGRPILSVVTVVYNMEREARLTLHSLSTAYQRNVTVADYEVIVVDNGSSRPLPREIGAGLAGDFRFHRIDPAPLSPARAVNQGAAMARGRYLAVMVDGARILSPGMLRAGLDALDGPAMPVVGSLSYHLGPEVHNRARAVGYDQRAEDELLAGIGWQADGYRLFDHAVPALSSRLGASRPPAESNCVFLSRTLFEELGGFDEAFDSPGGGFVNLDFWRRACEHPGTEVLLLLGEASFHQFHSGAATGLGEAELSATVATWADQYARIRGRRYEPPACRLRRIGELPGAPRGVRSSAAPTGRDEALP